MGPSLRWRAQTHPCRPASNSKTAEVGAAIVELVNGSGPGAVTAGLNSLVTSLPPLTPSPTAEVGAAIVVLVNGSAPGAVTAGLNSLVTLLPPPPHSRGRRRHR